MKTDKQENKIQKGTGQGFITDAGTRRLIAVLAITAIMMIVFSAIYVPYKNQADAGAVRENNRNEAGETNDIKTFFLPYTIPETSLLSDSVTGQGGDNDTNDPAGQNVSGGQDDQGKQDDPNEQDDPGGQDDRNEGDDPKDAMVPEIPEEPAKIAYITIDDGPSRAITPGILDLLAAEDIKATFFTIPQQATADVDEIYKRIVNEGHEIGNHTYTHRYRQVYDRSDISLFESEVVGAHDYIEEKYGYTMVSFRFPGGMMGRGASVLDPRKAILDELGYKYYDWHIDSGDARPALESTVPALVERVLTNTRNRDQLIVLFHDSWDKRTTLQALPEIIEGLRKQGYVFDILRNYREG